MSRYAMMRNAPNQLQLVLLLALAMAIIATCQPVKTSSSPLLLLPTCHPWLLPFDDSDLLSNLLGSQSQRDSFFAQDFGRQWIRFSSSTSGSEFPPILQQLVLHNQHNNNGVDLLQALYYSSPVTLRNRSSMEMVDPQRMSFEEFYSIIINQRGGSATFEVSTLDPTYRHNPLLPLKRYLEHAFGLPLTFNVYHSGPGGSALRRHADRYDVLAVQLHGTKEWTLCIPRLPASNTSASTTLAGSPTLSDYSPADAASMADTQFRNDENTPCGVDITSSHHTKSYHRPCCKDSNHTLRHGMDCSQQILSVGDVLYMPQGIVHVAQVPMGHSASTHAAIGFQKVPFRYVDLLFTWLNLAASMPSTTSSSPEHWKRLESLVKTDILKSPTQGLALRRLLPPWIWRHFQACIVDASSNSKEFMYLNNNHEAMGTLPSPRHWKCNRQKYQEAKRFLTQCLRSMVTMLRDAAFVANRHHDNVWLDDLMLAERLNDEKLVEDAIEVHAVEKIDFGALEDGERQAIAKAEHVQQEALQMMEKLMGASGGNGANGFNHLVASLTMGMNARQASDTKLPQAS